MKHIAILTRHGREHHHVANAICAHFPVAALIAESSPRPGLRRRLARRTPRHALSLTSRRFFSMLIRENAARARALDRVLGDATTARFQHSHLVHEVPSINGTECRAILESVRPDLLIVYGTGIVRHAVLSAAGDIALNMHTGLSPEYRGCASSFWAIHNGQPELAGATVHECTSDVDGGRIFARAAAQLHPDDTLHDVFARCVDTGTRLLVQVVRSYLDGSLAGMPQDLSKGREYRAGDRSVLAEVRVLLQIRRGLIRRHALHADRS